MLSPRPRNLVRFPALVALVVSAGCENGVPPITPPEPPRPPVRPVVLPCDTPAPLHGFPDWSDPDFRGFIVMYREKTDPVAETTRLSARYGFTPRFVYRHVFPGFAGELTPEAVNGVRCEGSVLLVEVDYWQQVIPAGNSA